MINCKIKIKKSDDFYLKLNEKKKLISNCNVFNILTGEK